MARRSKSQSALPQMKGWGSAEPELQLDFMVGSRPPSALPTRPAANKRPPSAVSAGRLQPKYYHGNALPSFESHPNPPPSIRHSSIERPQSGARPLSGRVFMRRSAKHGWTAKAYPQLNSSHSQPDLLGSETDLVSTASLDSFFDDDFEEESEEKLGSLLSCNTLGVETKAGRRDWVSGEVDIPKFHCPRCRDHWYGYSSVPCDEELARLIREGLWHTGNKEKKVQGSYKPGMFVPGHTQTDTGDTAGSTSSTPRGKLPRLKSGYKKNTPAGNGDWQNKQGEGDKRKRRITFKLDDSASDGSSTDLNSNGLAGGAGHMGGANELGKTGSNGSGLRKIGRGRADGGGGASGGDTDLGRIGEGKGHNKGRSSSSNGDVSSGDQSSYDYLLSGGCGNGGKEATNGGSHNLNSAHIKSSAQQPWLQRSTETNLPAGKYSWRNGHDGSQGLETTDGSNSKNSSGRVDGLSAGAAADTSGKTTATSQLEGDDKDTNGSNFGNGNRKTGNGAINSGPGSSGEDGTSSAHPVDHGKRIRKPGGYMRAVSPTSSEWGDHLHARSFISSSIHSRSGSISSISGGRGPAKDSETSLNGAEKLPPIVPRIIGPDDHLSEWRPNITRAWTFSYFNTS